MSSCSIDIKSLETSLDNIFGCKLSEIPSGGGKKQIDICKRFIKRYSNSGLSYDLFVKLSKEFFGEDLKPSAMFFENIAEMSKKILLMYQLSYAHYILGRYNNSSFPSYCCGVSAENLLAAFWEAGIISAVKVGNNSYDHAYLIIPFIIKTPDLMGVVLIDPTSDQLINDGRKKVRNLVMVLTEEKWTYVTDWKNGGNLYPEDIEISACYGHKIENYNKYLEDAFKNPVIVV